METTTDAPPANPTVNIRHDARYECEGATTEVREDEPRLRLTHGFAVRDSQIEAYLTEREAVCIIAVLEGAISYLRSNRRKGMLVG
jgi:hypothetical protein